MFIREAFLVLLNPPYMVYAVYTFDGTSSQKRQEVELLNAATHRFPHAHKKELMEFNTRSS